MPPANFHDAFFSRSMHQHFNRAVGSNDDFADEAPVRRYLRRAGQLQG